MIVDAHDIPGGSVLQTDVCIIGSGPAGSTLARQMIGERFRVCVVEAGGIDFEPGIQKEARVVSIDSEIDINDTRRWQFGGTANMWSVKSVDFDQHVRYLPLSEIDFEKRDWIRYSGWPFLKSDLDPFYVRAQVACGIGSCSFRTADWESPEVCRFPLDEKRVTTAIEHVVQAENFTKKALQELGRAENITVLLHANVRALDENPLNSVIDHAHIDCATG